MNEKASKIAGKFSYAFPKAIDLPSAQLNQWDASYWSMREYERGNLEQAIYYQKEHARAFRELSKLRGD